MTKNPVCTTSDDHTRFVEGDAFDGTALRNEDGIIFRRIHGDWNTVVGKDQFPEFAGRDVLFVLFDKLAGIAQFLCRLIDKIFVVKFHAEFFSQLLSNLMSATSILT